MKRKEIDVEELKKVFRLKDGNLERSNPNFKSEKWKQVKLLANNATGYCQVGFNGRKVYYHAIVWILSTSKDIPEGIQIDHINGNRLDNRMENLRLVTDRANQQNQKAHRKGKLVGCSFDKHSGKYMATIKISGKPIYLGRYDTEHEAHEAYKIACKHIERYIGNASFREIIKKEGNK